MTTRQARLIGPYWPAVLAFGLLMQLDWFATAMSIVILVALTSPVWLSLLFALQGLLRFVRGKLTKGRKA